jgi:hypothetical protein
MIPGRFVQKQLKSFEIWGWRRMEKISWNDHVIKEVLKSRIRGIFYIKYLKGRRTGLV